MISVDNFYDQNSHTYQGEQFSNTIFTYEVVDTAGPVLTIKNIFHVTAPDGKTIFKAEPLYSINAFNGKHISDYGNQGRSGYLFSPRWLSQDDIFQYWHVSSSRPSIMKYAGEKMLYGLRVFKFESQYEWLIDQTEFMHHLPGVPEKRGISLDNRIAMWIEPLSWYVVKIEDYSVDYFYFDSVTKERLFPYNKFLNTYTEKSVLEHIEHAKKARNKIIIIQIFIPLFFFFSISIVAINKSFPSLFIFSREYFLPFLIFGCGCMITFFVFDYSRVNIEKNEKSEFSLQTNEIFQLISGKINTYTQVLSGWKWLFDASNSVERSEWYSYVDSLNMRMNDPGIQWLGFSRVIPASEKQKIINSIRDEWFWNFSITPEGDRDIYTSILFLEPFDEMNKRAFWYDMFSEPTRREAMIRARDSWVSSASRKVILKQESGDAIQNGFLIYVPVYHKNKDVSTLESRRENIFWYIYAPFRVNDLMQAIFSEPHYQVSFRIFDGLTTNPANNLYTSPSFLNNDEDIVYRDIKTFVFSGHTWTIEFVNSQTFARNAIYNRVQYWIVVLCISISFLLAYMVHVVMISRKKAVAYAKKVNKKLIKNIWLLEQTQTSLVHALDDSDLQKEKFEKINTRFRIATSSAKLGVWEWDIVRDKLIWDDQMYILYGVKKGDFIGAYDAWKNGLHPDDKKMSDDAVQMAMSGKKDLNQIFRVVMPTGEIRYIQAHAIVERDFSGKPIRMIGVNWDVTREKNIDRQKTEFVSIASHQLRTPLTAIRWYTEMFMNEDVARLSPHQKKYMHQICQSNQFMIDLVNKLLNVSRIELGTLKIESEPTDICVIAENIICEQQKNIKAKKIIFERYFQKIPKYTTDPTLLRMVLQNVFANALKYTPSHGKISWSISLKKKTILINITDNGCGIPRIAKDQIFYKFFRAENTKDVTGTGLGLYIVKSILDMFGGTISFESISSDVAKWSNTGTTFLITLPLAHKKSLWQKRG
jgi:signal transduction histidine kinase/CHASE1-domain containing sensor protein